MKRFAALALGFLLLANSVFVPKQVKAEDLNVWKFDFGAEGTTAEKGYELVTPHMHVINNENREYGFIGTNEKDYRLNGGRVDGFIQQKGQVIDLVATKNGIGSLGIKDKTVTDFNSGDYYPVRFALKVPDETYYRVKATVTTLDDKKGATASLYTERKHPIFTKKSIAPGEVVEAEFTVRVTPVYYEKSDPQGLIGDGYVNVCLLGENTALAKVEIKQLESAPTLWILGDSTVTDGGGVLPFFPLQNYTGVGTATTKYLPESIAMVNEGEGGLSAGDNSHFNTVKSRLKAGDFLWVEYGHNHKTDGAEGYKNCLGKYYDACKAVGATLILVGPIDRINWYDASINKWNSSLKAFSDAAKAFVDAKLKENPEDKIAFVDLNEPSLEWFGKITEKGVVDSVEVTNEARLVNFYFQCAPGAKDVDHTHPNDAGAENLAYLFFENADCNTYPALKPLLARYNNNKAEEPNLVDAEIVNMGYPANEAWPVYSVGTSYDYPLVITRVNVTPDNRIESLTCKLQDKNLLTSYGAGFVEINSVTYQTTIESHIDNSAANNGSVYTVKFAEDNMPYLENGKDTSFRAYMAGVDMEDNDKMLEGAVYSADYTPMEIGAYIVPGPDGEEENFDYYGYNTLTGSGDWFVGGSAAHELKLGGESGGKCYAHIKVMPSSNNSSFTLNRSLQNISGGITSSGRYLFSVEFKTEEESAGGLVFQLANGWRNSSPFVLGDSLTLFEVMCDGSVKVGGKVIGSVDKASWGSVKCVLDVDAALLIASVDNKEEHVFSLPQYESFKTPQTSSLNNFVISTTGGNASVDMKLANLVCAQYNLYDNIKTTLTLSSQDNGGRAGEFGSVYVGYDGQTAATVNAGDFVTAVAKPTANGRFLGWYMDGVLYDTNEEVTLRMYKDATLTGIFAQQTPASDVVINYVDKSGKKIKESDIVNVNEKGQALHEEMSFGIAQSHKAVIINENGGYYDVYFFSHGTCESIDSLGKKGSNVIDLVFDYDGAYFEYEDFEKVENTWGFTGEAMKGDGCLELLTGVGTNNRTSSVKKVDDKISQCKNLTVRFDWRNTVDTGKGRSSSFDLLDEKGNYIFSINAKGKSGIDYGVGRFADTVISSNWSGVNDWYKIVLTMDFEKGMLSGSITNKNTGGVIAIEPSKIDAENLAVISATYGYSSAGQQLDNFGFRDDGKTMVKSEIVKSEDGVVTVKLQSGKGGKFCLVTSSYKEDKLLRVVTKNVTLEEALPKEITVDTATEGRVEVWLTAVDF